MAEVYGHKWVSQYGEVSTESGELTSAAKTWAQGLSKLSMDEISSGFSGLLDREDGWPPSLPEFISLAKPKRAPFHKPALALPSSTMTRDEVVEALNGLRSATRGTAE